jgi:hypothetical protein
VIKRIFGWILFAWMALCIVGLFVENGPGPGGATGLGMKVGIGAFMVAVAIIGLMMGLGKNTDTGPPQSKDDTLAS